jgi:hypothetical protein
MTKTQVADPYAEIDRLLAAILEAMKQAKIAYEASPGSYTYRVMAACTKAARLGQQVLGE